jgi:hypothetical protein
VLDFVARPTEQELRRRAGKWRPAVPSSSRPLRFMSFDNSISTDASTLIASFAI